VSQAFKLPFMSSPVVDIPYGLSLLHLDIRHAYSRGGPFPARSRAKSSEPQGAANT
jgi:hypothetical protein